MNYIRIKKSGKYLPKRKILNEEIEKELNLESGYIYKRTGIKERYYIENETIIEMAEKASEKIFEKGISKDNIGLIIVATTSSEYLMPGIANEVQKRLEIGPCICLDILAGCSGYINSFDIAKMYIEIGKVEKALIIGVDILSKYIDLKDIGTKAVLSDGAGAILLERTKENKKYFSNIKSDSTNNEILKCKTNQKIYMEGKEVYKYAVTKTVENIEELLLQSGENLKNIKYIVPHQSNKKIMKAIASRLKINSEKMYMNIETKGNTFCASIPIAISEMQEKELLKEGDKIILLGYGGGLNTGSILLEI